MCWFSHYHYQYSTHSWQKLQNWMWTLLKTSVAFTAKTDFEWGISIYWLLKEQIEVEAVCPPAIYLSFSPISTIDYVRAYNFGNVCNRTGEVMYLMRGKTGRTKPIFGKWNTSFSLKNVIVADGWRYRRKKMKSISFTRYFVWTIVHLNDAHDMINTILTERRMHFSHWIHFSLRYRWIYSLFFYYFFLAPTANTENVVVVVWTNYA